jgi:hypothetical protein
MKCRDNGLKEWSTKRCSAPAKIANVRLVGDGDESFTAPSHRRNLIDLFSDRFISTSFVIDVVVGGATTFSIMTVNITTLGIMTLGIMTL